MDGNDLLAVHAATRDAVARARRGEGPTLIEAVTYRLRPHSTADDPTKYQDPAEAATWAAREPLIRLRRYLEGRGLVDEARHARWDQEADAEVRAAVARFDERVASAGPA